MKKILFLLAITFATLTSCSTDETPVAEQAIQKTSVALLVKQPTSEGSTTAKDVKRGDIPTSVSNIKVKATYNGTPAYAKEDNWNIVADNTAGASENFILTDVAVGNNTFVASTETTAVKRFELLTASGDADERITLLKTHIPYVLYTGNKTQDIFQTANVVNIPMTTIYGRILTVFLLDDSSNFKNNYAATITAKVYNSTGTLLATNNGPKINGSGLASFEWSNELSVLGNKVVYTVDVTPYPNNNNNLHTIYTVEQVIKASTSISCIYTITKDKAPSPYTSENKLVFSFQKWVEENCPDYPNCK
jgi:hypothetical protein